MDLNFGVQINPVKQTIQSNSVGSWNMPHCGTSTFENHFDYRLIVLKDVQHSTRTKTRCIWWNVINVRRKDGGAPDWDGAMHARPDNCRRAPRGSLLGPSVPFGTGWNTLITKSLRARAGRPSMRKPPSREMISASVELCETEVCFLHIQLIGTNVWLPEIHNTPPEVEFDCSKSPAESKSWNNPSLHCCDVFPT